MFPRGSHLRELKLLRCKLTQGSHSTPRKVFQFLKQILKKEPNPKQANARLKTQTGSCPTFPPQLTKANSDIYKGSFYIYWYVQKKDLNLEDAQAEEWIAINPRGYCAQPLGNQTFGHPYNSANLLPIPPWTLNTKKLPELFWKKRQWRDCMRNNIWSQKLESSLYDLIFLTGFAVSQLYYMI